MSIRKSSIPYIYLQAFLWKFATLWIGGKQFPVSIWYSLKIDIGHVSYMAFFCFLVGTVIVSKGHSRTQPPRLTVVPQASPLWPLRSLPCYPTCHTLMVKLGRPPSDASFPDYLSWPALEHCISVGAPTPIGNLLYQLLGHSLALQLGPIGPTTLLLWLPKPPLSATAKPPVSQIYRSQ